MLSRLHRMKGLTALIAGMMAVSWTAPAFSQASAAQAADITNQIQASLQAIEDGQLEAARDRWDPQYVVDQVGSDPLALLAWVREHTAWVAYRGALRGPQGVLMDRVGNSLDRALLLATMLRLAGVRSRLARAKLPGDQLDDVWARVVTPGEAAVEADASPVEGAATLQEAADLYGIDPAAVTRSFEQIETEGADLITQLGARVGSQTAELAGRADLRASGDGGAALLAAQKEMLADHWWVQAEIAGAWTDLDPLAADGASAVAGAAAETLDPESLPESVEHGVTLRVVTEQLKDGRLVEQVPLEQALRPRDMIGRPVHFLHVPVKWPADWPETLPDTVQVKLRAALYSQHEWLPAFVVGDEGFRRASVLATGALNENPSPGSPFQDMTVVMMGNIKKATDVLTTGGDDTAEIAGIEGDTTARPPDPEGELTAEWLEFEIDRPGEETKVTRREVFDLVGPARRASGDLAGFTMSEAAQLARATALLGESWLEIMPAKTAPEFVFHLAGENVVANKPLLDEMASDPFSKLPANYTEVMTQLKPFPAALYAVAGLRFGTPAGDLVYLDRPSILAQHTTLSRGGGGDFVPASSIDIVENGVGILPAAAADAAVVRLAQGIADTNAESLVAARWGSVTGNTADALAADREGWVTLQPGDAGAVAALGLPADLAARILTTLAGGLVVVVPTDPELARTAGWWQIDPRDGATLGVGPNGHGAAMVEYALVLIIQGMIAAAVCMIQEAGVRVMEKELRDANVARQAIGSVVNRGTAFRCAAGGVAAMLQMHLTTASIGILQARMLRAQAAANTPRPPGGTSSSGGRGGGGSGGGGSPQAGNSPGGPPRGSPPPGPQNPPGGRPQPPPGNQPNAPQPPTPGNNPQSSAPKGQGPYQSDRPYLDKAYKDNPNLANIIGPKDRVIAADQQAQKTYESVVKDTGDAGLARQQSEAAWKDHYQNYWQIQADLAKQQGLAGTMPANAQAGMAGLTQIMPGVGVP